MSGRHANPFRLMVYYSSTEPTGRRGGYEVGEIWIDLHTNTTHRHDGTRWVPLLRRLGT